jgi:poly(A) polymerase
VLLKPIEDGALGFKIWNPKTNPRDRLHLMPAITPAYPSMNSTFNVSRTTLRIMKEEFDRGADLTLRAETNQEKWEKLFEETDFFIRYHQYLEIEVSSINDVDHRAWVGFIESRLRFFLHKLETIENILIHPYPASFDKPKELLPQGTFANVFYIGLEYSKGANTASAMPTTTVEQNPSNGKSEVDLTSAVADFESQINEWLGRKPTMLRPVVHPIKRNQIPVWVLPKDKKKELIKSRKQKQASDKELSSPSSNKRVRTNDNEPSPSMAIAMANSSPSNFPNDPSILSSSSTLMPPPAALYGKSVSPGRVNTSVDDTDLKDLYADDNSTTKQQQQAPIERELLPEFPDGTITEEQQILEQDKEQAALDDEMLGLPDMSRMVRRRTNPADNELQMNLQ